MTASRGWRDRADDVFAWVLDAAGAVAAAARRASVTVEDRVGPRWAKLGRRARIAVAAVVTVAALAGTAAALAAHANQRPVLDPADATAVARLEAVAATLASDFSATAPLVDDDLIRTFDHSDDGGITGTVARSSTTGRCWGFELRVGRDWISSGDADAVTAGDVVELDDAACR